MEADLVPDTTCVNSLLDAHVALKPVPKKYTKASFSDKPVRDPDGYVKARYQYFKNCALKTDQRAGIQRRPFASYAQFYAFFTRAAGNQAFVQSVQTNSALRHWASVATEYHVSRIDKTKAFTYENLVLSKKNQCLQRFDPKSAQKNRNHYVEYEGVQLHLRRVWQSHLSIPGFKSYSGFFNFAKNHNFNVSATLARHKELAFKCSKNSTTIDDLDSKPVKVAQCYVHNIATPTGDSAKIVRNSVPNLK